jgi:LysR family transcriptional regulator, hypochlorite-specific transcription factor HypT
LGGAVAQLIKQSATPVHLDRVYETDMSEGLKAMALEGHGVAFLPASSVRKEVRAKKLVLAGQGLEATLDIRIYRERPHARKVKRALEQFWSDLQTRVGAVG